MYVNKCLDQTCDINSEYYTTLHCTALLRWCMVTGPGLRLFASMHEILSEILRAGFGFS
jgi:hypothetical protein